MATLTLEETAPGDAPARISQARGTWWPLGLMLVAVLFWAHAMWVTRPQGMTEVGLVSVLPWTWFAAMALMAAGFALSLPRSVTPRWLPTAFPLVLSAMFYLTPPLLYGTARYSWAWKHAGIVDYILRTGSVDRDIANLSVYHNWPGFFAFNAVLTDLTGLQSPMSYAAWAEVFFNVLTVAALMALLRCLTDEARIVAVGGWLFVLGNWVGQGYWSPQATSYLWYLLVLAVLLRWFPGRHGPDRLDALPGTGAGAAPWAETSPARRVGAMCVVLLLVIAIVSTHQLTPLAIALTTAALVVFRRTDALVLPLLTAVSLAAWLLYIATPFTASNVPMIFGAIGAIGENVQGTLVSYGSVSEGLKLVSLTARALTVVICLLAAAGFVLAVRRGQRHYTALILVAAPVSLVAFSPYGSEILFRAYLFALPGLAFFAALALVPPGRAVSTARSVVIGVVSLVLMSGFALAEYGNDYRYHFTRAEVRAAEYVYEKAPEGSLLVEGSRDYPGQFENYEKFTYTPIDLEDPAGREKMVAHPVKVLESWMEDERYTAAYLFITRSQKLETESSGSLPGGGLSTIESRLLRSPKFRAVYRNRDAVVFVLAENAVPPPADGSWGARR